MCGILGALALGGATPVDPGKMERLLPLIRHRGPDGSGVAQRGPACFGHTRLSIIGLHSPHAAQPVAAGNRLLTFNGEIYNFRALKDELVRDGVSTSGESDTEVLFACLQHWGLERTLKQADGMFAFAYWDGNGNLYLARDRLGEKPCFWAHANGRFWFASEMKVLLAVGGISNAPNLSRIDDYFYTGIVNGNQTIYQDINEVDPGHYIHISQHNGQIRPVSYWDIVSEATEFGAADAPTSDIAAFQAQLDAAIESRNLSDAKLGVLLSGGIDSNTIAESIISQGLRKEIPFYFSDNDQSELSEKRYVDIFLDHMAERFPSTELNLHAQTIGYDTFLANLETLIRHFDEPVVFQNSPFLAALCSRAHTDGVKVLLSGEGSDELFYGYDRFSRTAGILGSTGNTRATLEHLYFGGGIHTKNTVGKITGTNGEGAEATQPWQWLEKHIGLPLDDLQGFFSQRFRMLTLLQRQDRVGMSHSIEIRVPFLAPALVNYANRLHISHKYDPRTATTKHILRQAVEGRLPREILHKKKDGWPCDMLTWIRQPHVRQLLDGLVRDSNSFTRNHLNAPAVLSLIEDHFSHRSSRDILIWEILVLEMWHLSAQHHKTLLH